MNENKENVPKLRFPGFTDGWEKRKFESMFDRIPNNTLSRADLNYDGGKIKSIHYGDILVKYGAVTDCGKDEIPFITGAEVSNHQSQLLHNGDVLIADAAEDETVGKATEIAGITGIPVVSGLHTIACRPKVKMQPNYLGYYMNSPSYHQQLLPLMQGIKVLSISWSNLAKTTICYPTSAHEQSKIGNAFADLDSLITLHQRKLNNVKNLKAGLLQKMFPKAGEDFPEVRFPGFTDAWEQRELSQLVDVRSGRDYKHLADGDIPVYGTGGYMLSVSEALSYNEDAIGIGRKGTIDKPYILNAPFWTVDTLFYAVPKNKNDLDFIFNIFQKVNWKQKDESTGVPSLSKVAINSVQVIVPDYKEQKAIGEFFAQFDHLITLHQRKLKHLQEQKKALLQQMFV
ncbi:restriction endonuclease subunit S [Paenibacillus rubinfantis]|uniref:restriction endonuclease subunit S n=1 Tax=Paenibacillus rubinfantis TaxID=1720296 RepID=UPI00073E7891|nr:restriction endonuclease subunit S [Paenibacillus rubinfantis]